MKHEFTNSSSIQSAEYDEDSHILTITFYRGKSYQYEDVPKEIYDQLITSESAGRFFQTQIKPYFQVIQ